MNGQAIRIIAMGAALVGAAGCTSPDAAYFLNTKSRANVFVAREPSPIRKLAVMPFKAETELIGSSVSDMFVTELLRAGRYELVERSQIAKVLGESELAVSGISDARAAEVAMMMGADGVVIGTVDEYGTVAVRGRAYPQVGMAVRMIDCATGKIMWSADLAKRSTDKSAILSAFARSVAHEIVAGVYRQWDRQRYVARPARAARTAASAPAAPAPAAPVPPPDPPAFSLSDMGLREVRLSWSAPAARAREYRIARASDRNGPFAEITRVPVSRREYCDTGSARAPLVDGTVYYYRLTSVGADGRESAPSAVQESMTAPPPEPPGGVTAAAPAPRAVKLSWSCSPPEMGVRRYEVARAPAAAEAAFEPVGAVEKPEFEEGGSAASPLADRTVYRYRVRAINKVGAVGAWSEPVQVTTLPPPAPPDAVTAVSAEVRCVPLSWTWPDDPFLVRVDVYRADAPDGEGCRIGSVKASDNPAFLDGGRNPGTLPDDTPFWYRLVAVNRVEAASDPSAPVEARTRPRPPPVAALRAESGLPRMARLAWTPSADEKVIGYSVQRAEGEEGAFETIGSVDGRDQAAYEDRGRARPGALGTLADGALYRYRVAAWNAARTPGAWSDPAEVRTKPVPHAPEAVSAVSGLPRWIELSWPAVPEADIVEYRVERSLDGKRFREAGRVPADAEGGLLWNEQGLADGETRYFRVKAVDRDTLESAWSDTATATAKPAPPAPGTLAAEAGDGIRLTWSAPAVDDIVSYTVWQKKLWRWVPLGTSEETGFRISAETVDQGITVAVSATDADGLESEKSPPLAIPAPPARQ